MAEITLGDYTGFILLEMIRARVMADAYSETVARKYEKDPVLQHFPVPRFRVPKITLGIPVLISGARFSQTVRLDLPVEEFVTAITRRANDVRTAVQLAMEGPWRRKVEPRPDPNRPGPIRPDPGSPVLGAPAVEPLAREFHEQLCSNTDLTRPDTVVTVMWARIFQTTLEEAGLADYYAESDPSRAQLTRTTAEVLEFVRSRTVVDRTAVDSLLINPETSIVKDGSSEATVFTITAELVEEGFYVRSVRDESTNQVRTIVELE